MDHVFWLVPGRLAGRPGPNRRPWDLAGIRALGIGAVLSVNDGDGCEAASFPTLGLAYECVPLPPNEPPLPGDEELCEEALPNAYRFVSEQHSRGRAVLVHCSAGKDRTGLLMSYFLMQEEGLDVETALQRVRAVRPNALSAVGWEALGRRVLARLSARAR